MDRIITIGRQFGAGGREIGKAVAARLEIPYYDKELLVVAAKESGLDTRFLENYDERTNSLLYSLVMGQAGRFYGGHQYDTVETLAARAQREALLSVARNGPCVIVGRCADVILRNEASLLRVFISANEADRIAHVCKRDGVNENEAAAKLRRMDRERRNYYNGTTDGDWGHASSYDLCLNTSVIGRERCVEIIVSCALAE